MHIKSLIVAMGVALAALTSAAPLTKRDAPHNYKVAVSMWKEVNCPASALYGQFSNHPGGAYAFYQLKPGECRSVHFNDPFYSYKLKYMAQTFHWPGDDMDPPPADNTCRVVIYNNVECYGDGYDSGHHNANGDFNHCIDVPDGGRSVAVICDWETQQEAKNGGDK